MCAPLFAGTASGALLPPKEGPVGEKHRPAVEAIAAQKEIRHGYMYKIYVRASDPDGDLDKIHIIFSQTAGAITNSLLTHKKTGKLNGYIAVWARLEGTEREVSTVDAEVEIRVEDRAGNMSEPKKLEFEVGDFNKEDKFKPPAAFHAGNKLGQAEFELLTEDENVGDERFR
jgi:hypothetical protein